MSWLSLLLNIESGGTGSIMGIKRSGQKIDSSVKSFKGIPNRVTGQIHLRQDHRSSTKRNQGYQGHAYIGTPLSKGPGRVP